MSQSKHETILELVARLDKLRAEDVDLGAAENFEAAVFDEWPRLKDAVQELWTFIEGHIANYPNPAGPEARKLLARLDNPERP